MGIIGSIGKKVASAAGKKIGKAIVHKAIDESINTVSSHFEETRSVEALINKSNSNFVLMVNKNTGKHKIGYSVKDEFDTEKYWIIPSDKTYIVSLIHLYDISGNELGRVERLSTNRFGLSVNGKQIGFLTREGIVKCHMILDLNGWQISGDYFRSSFTVTDQRGTKVMSFNEAFDTSYTFIIEMNNREFEIIGLLLFAAVMFAKLHAD